MSWALCRFCGGLERVSSVAYFWARPINPLVPKVNLALFNPLVPRVEKIKIRKLTLNRLLAVEFVKKMVYLGAHYSERQGLMG